MFIHVLINWSTACYLQLKNHGIMGQRQKPSSGNTGAKAECALNYTVNFPCYLLILEYFFVTNVAVLHLFHLCWKNMILCCYRK